MLSLQSLGKLFPLHSLQFFTTTPRRLSVTAFMSVYT